MNDQFIEESAPLSTDLRDWKHPAKPKSKQG